MLTCTVSMVENAIAIIATCLPALRSLIIGTNNTKSSSNSYGKHYELSSARRKANQNRMNSVHLDTETPSTHNILPGAERSRNSLSSDDLLRE
jgi:hypothetical protein